MTASTATPHAKTAPRELIQFRVPAGIGQQLNDIAKQDSRSRSSLLEKLVTDLVNQHTPHGAHRTAQPQTT